MSIANKLSRPWGLLRNIRGKKNSDKIITIDELVNPRLGMNISNGKNAKNIVNSLQLLMYSKENDTLFI
jgi:hypothetical protein